MEKLLLDSIPELTAEMYKNQEGIPEPLFDKLAFPIDKDDEDNEWPLTSRSIVFGRSQPMISQMALERRTAVMVKDVETRRVERV